MHENLKSTVSLKKDDNLKKLTNNWQLLISDYCYGTFYALYGKFRGETKNNIFHPKECDLFLQNYQGNITIGLVSVGEIDIAYDEILEEAVYILPVHVRALHANEKLPEKPLKVKDSPGIKVHSKFLSKKYDRLVNNTIDCTFNIRIELIFEPLCSGLFDKTELSKSRLIDAIEFKRDGDQLHNIGKKVYNTKTGIFESPNNGEDHVRFEHKLVRKGAVVDLRCNPKYVKFRT